MPPRAGPSHVKRLGALVAIAAILVVGCGDRGPTSAPLRTAPGASAASRAPSPTAPSSPVPASPSDASSSGAFDPTTLRVTLTPFVDALEAPLAIVNAADDSGRLFVVEQRGRIRIVRDGKVLAAAFLDLASEVSSGGERGLLGLAFHPRYPDDPRFFVDYTDRDGNTQVSSFRVSPDDPDRADPASELKILSVEQPFANHNGGAVLFDPAGRLLVSLGDGGSGGDPRGSGQSLDTLLGKILRLDVDETSADRRYAIPTDNPFADGTKGRPEIWLSGLRNPWRMSLDPANGDLWIGDVGQSEWEEVDVQRATSPGGTNFGWNRMEGRHCFEPGSGCEDPTLTLPVAEYGHEQGCTVIGGIVDRASASPLSGGYLFGDYCSGRLWAIDPGSDAVAEPAVVGESGVNLSAFGQGEDGTIYAADISGGRVLRVVATRS